MWRPPPILRRTFNGVVSVVSFEEEMVLEVATGKDEGKSEAAAPRGYSYGARRSWKTSLLDAIRYPKM